MDPINYSRLAGSIFAVVAILQLVRALAGWSVSRCRRVAAGPADDVIK